MKKTDDLERITLTLEDLVKKRPKLTRAETVDIGARVNALMKAAEKLDKSIKEDIEKWRHQKAGEVKGEMFTAILAYYPTIRLNQTKFKEADPDTHSMYCETSDERRIIYQLR